MLYELGSLLFRLGIAVTVSYFVVFVLAASLGAPVPRELAEANAFTSLLSGRFGGLVATAGMAAGALVGIKAVEMFSRIFFGRSLELELGKFEALVAFMGLFVVAQAGISTAVDLLIAYVGWAVPPLAAGVTSLRILVNALSMVGLSYFLMVKVFGAPTF